MQSIEWRPVVGYECCYEVSESGEVRRLARTAVRKNGRVFHYPARLLRPSRDPHSGYLKYHLWRDGKGRMRPKHRLVAEAFVDNPDALPLVRHWDGDHDNNHYSNLRWGTQSDNMYDMVRHGRNHNAEKTHCKREHAFTDENTWRIAGKTGRICKQCKRATNAAYEARSKRWQGADAVRELAEEMDERTGTA